MLEEMIKTLGFVKTGDDIKLDRDTFEKNIKLVIEKCQLFVNSNKSQPLFGYDKRAFAKLKKKIEDVELKDKNNKISKPFMGFMNELLAEEWGIYICCSRRSCKKDNKVCKSYMYSLSYMNEINKYV